ncbi:MAG: hypothetical protein KH230_08110 [Enterocloster asparagiformis]|nr:hypothetical protein [Enterocloster asparagiformis]
MERILEQLYAGDLCPADNSVVENPNYRSLCKANLEETDRFANSLTEERREAFDIMMDHYLEVCFMEKTQAFADGFRMGAQVMCEVFREAAQQ